MSLIQALQNPAAYPHPVDKIELIETHISWILLTGQYAYKIKKNVRFSFLDFSTLEKRHFYCLEELRFNSRFAPDLYLDVVPVTGSLQDPHINGNGEAIEYAVKMKQFDGNLLLSHIADRGELSATIIDQLAVLIADFHLHAATDVSDSKFGSPEQTHYWFRGNFTDIKPLITNDRFCRQILQLEQWGELQLSNNTRLMAQRKQNGFIRMCHGDLHLGNIALINNRVTPFDGIEFNTELHWLDVINEIAFVVMDLQQRGLKPMAYRFLNHYLRLSGDYEGLTLLPYYLVYRALVRCKVALFHWQQFKEARYLQEAESYANMAEGYSKPTPPKLFITHGYSGSGKSTYTMQMAEKLGMIHLRTDIERKRLIDESQKDVGNAVNQGLYTPKNIALVYHRLVELASSILNAGFSVVIDAAFLQSEQRDLFAELALAKQMEFVILDFYAPEQELKRRIITRQQSGNDASEATLAVLEHQLKTAQALSATEQKKVIQIDTCAPDALNKLLQRNSL